MITTTKLILMMMRKRQNPRMISLLNLTSLMTSIFMARHSGEGRRGGGRFESGDASQAGGSSSGANARHRRHRGTNLGIFGRSPAVPHTVRVTVDSAHILDPIAKATMHAICLTHLPTGCMCFNQYGQYDASFMDTVLREFHTYFRYEEGISQAAGDGVIIAYYVGWLYEMR